MKRLLFGIIVCGFLMTNLGYTQTTLYWNGASPSANPASGGTGTWNASNAWRSGSDTGPATTWTTGANNNSAIIAGTAGTISLGSSGTGTFSGTDMTVNTSGYTILSSSSSRNLVFTGALSLANNVGLTLSINNASGTWSVGTLIFSPNSSLTIVGAASAGNTNLLKLTSESTIGGGSIIINGSAAGGVGILAGVSGGNSSTPKVITLNANISNNSSSATVLGANQYNVLNYGGELTGTARLMTSGAGTVAILSSNNFSGGTMVSTGTLALSGSGTLGSTSGALTVNGGTLSLGSTNQTVGAVTLSGGTISSTSGTLTGSSYAVSGGAISASLGGSGAMTVTGSTTLSGNNSSFSGTISINSGTLTAGHANALGTGTTTVNSGATLTIDSGVGLAQTAKIALSNGTLLGAAETSSFAGTLSGSGIISSLTLTSAAVIQWSLNTLSTDANSANKYSLAGALVLDGASVQVAGLSPSSDPFWGSNRSWVVVSSNSQTITGSLLVNNSGWSSLGSFATGTNGSGDVTLNWTAAGAPIPEPSTYAALAGGVALAWVVVRRRRTALPRA